MTDNHLNQQVIKIEKRLPHIDLLKCIAIFFVIIYHGSFFKYSVIEANSIRDYLLYFSRTILSTCVPLFFFTNGYLLLKKEFVLKKHIYKIIRLMLLVITWMIILMSIYLTISGETINVKLILKSVLMMDGTWSMNVFWFIGALICIYILFPALKSVFDYNKQSFIFFIIVCFILTFVPVLCNQIIMLTKNILHHNLNSINYPLITMINPFKGTFGYSFVYFCMGGLAYTYEDKIIEISPKKRNVYSIIGLIVSCLCLFGVGIYYSKCVNGKNYDMVWNGYDTIFTLLNVIFIYILSLNYTKDNRFIKKLSSNTLGIYFIHIILIRITRSILILNTILNNYFLSIIWDFGIMCFCLLVCMLIKKIPVLKDAI